MDPCIQPSCSCKAYKDPKHSKGTLLQLRLGCQECGHQASEHRKLTAVDRYIKKEVDKAAKSLQCVHRIPTREIPLSPIFRNYDLIPLPSDECGTPSDQESGVQCTCNGFSVQNIVRVLQKFRTYTVESVTTSLPKIMCSFCNHPLSDHQTTEQGPDSNKSVNKPVKGYRRLVSKGSVKLELTPFNRKCVLLVPPENANGYMMLVGIVRSTCSEEFQLEMVTVLQSLSSSVDDDNAEKENNTISGVSTAEDDSSAGGKLAQDREGKTDSIANEQGASTDFNPKKGQAKRKRKLSESVGLRKSARIAAKKQKIEVDVSTSDIPPAIASKLKDLKSIHEAHTGRSRKMAHRNLTLLNLAASQYSRDEVESESEPPAGVLKHVKENTDKFFELLKKGESYKCHCFLPQEHSHPDADLTMAAQCISTSWQASVEPSSTPNDVGSGSGKDSKEDAVLVAVGSHSSGWVHLTVLYPISTPVDTQWTPLFTPSQATPSKPSCLSWSKTSVVESGEEKVVTALICVGFSSGNAGVWKVQLKPSQASVLDVFSLGKLINTTSQLTVCSWSPDGRLLLAGTVLGDVLVYSLDKDEAGQSTSSSDSMSIAALQHLQTLHCCGASVTCMSWSRDCRLVAVGGSDDCIQILQCKEPPVSKPPPQPSANSILKYFKPEASQRKHKLVHTHTIKGHQSFIADLKFLGDGHSLSSVGWDGQLLFWNNLLLASLPTTSNKLKDSKSELLPYTEVEPYRGYKIGPSAAVEFIPLALYPLLDCGLAVVVQNKLSGFTLISYMKK